MKRLGNPAYRRLGIQGLPYGFGPQSSRSYLRRILTPNPGVGYDPSSLILYHPMNESVGGVAIDHSPEGNDGAYTGVTLGQPGIGDGLVCPFFDNDYNDIFSAGFDADFNGAEGTVAFWLNPFNNAMWSDGNVRRPVYIAADTQNRIFHQSGGGGVSALFFESGDVLKTFSPSEGPGWRHLAIAWSDDTLLDEVTGYDKGLPLGATQTGLGTWVGALDPTLTVVGAASTAPVNPWHGWIAHVAVWSTMLTAPQILYLGIL